MSDILPTVKIKSDGPKGYRIINREKYDADPSKYQLAGETSAPVAAKPAAKPTGRPRKEKA